MWISKHLRLSQAHSELETLIVERTAELQKLSQRLLKVQDDERRKSRATCTTAPVRHWLR
jgi:hypothetical protein